MSAEPTYTSLIQGFVQDVRSSNNNAQIAVILIGSVARSTNTSQSDLDVLVVGDRLPLIECRPGRLHVQALTAQQFVERLRAGDDFAAWCVRYGVPIVSSKPWLEIVGSSDAAIWPDWHPKIFHAARRLALAAALLETGDITGAAEEALYAVSHTGRAILLKGGVFPLSRPEMITQLREIQHVRLAKILEELSYQTPAKATLNRDLLYIKRILVLIDRASYREFVRSRQRRLLAKRARSAGLASALRAPLNHARVTAKSSKIVP